MSEKDSTRVSFELFKTVHSSLVSQRSNVLHVVVEFVGGRCNGCGGEVQVAGARKKCGGFCKEG